MSLPAGFPKYSEASEIKVLFVCLGNICRSPTADGVLRTLVKKRTNPVKITVDSCGTAGYHIGDSPDERTQKHGLARGYDLSELRARQLCASDYKDFDIILAADRNNLSVLKSRCPDSKYLPKLCLITDFLPKNSIHYGANEVPDPYYSSAKAFDLVIDLCEEACGSLLDQIVQH